MQYLSCCWVRLTKFFNILIWLALHVRRCDVNYCHMKTVFHQTQYPDHRCIRFLFTSLLQQWIICHWRTCCSWNSSWFCLYRRLLNVFLSCLSICPSEKAQPEGNWPWTCSTPLLTQSYRPDKLMLCSAVWVLTLYILFWMILLTFVTETIGPFFCHHGNSFPKATNIRLKSSDEVHACVCVFMKQMEIMDLPFLNA